MVRTTNQGLTGPHNTHPGWGWQMVGLGGICNLTGWPDREPLSFGMPYTDVIAPRFGAAALMAALIHRKKTGKGQLIDLSQLENGAAVHFSCHARLFCEPGERHEDGECLSLCSSPRSLSAAKGRTDGAPSRS